MEKVLVLKDGPHRLKPLSYWGIAYSQKLQRWWGAVTPASQTVAVLAALLSEAEEDGPNGEPRKEWGFREAAEIIPTPQHKHVADITDELWNASFADEDAAEDDEEPVADAVPPTPRPGAEKRSPGRKSSASPSR